MTDKVEIVEQIRRSMGLAVLAKVNVVLTPAQLQVLLGMISDLEAEVGQLHSKLADSAEEIRYTKNL